MDDFIRTLITHMLAGFVGFVIAILIFWPDIVETEECPEDEDESEWLLRVLNESKERKEEKWE